jgi:beta-glucosidase
MVTFQLNAARQIDEEEFERAVQLASDADVADVLLGTTEPGGRLPTTWPASEEGLPSTQPVDGVLTYDEGLFIGYRAYDRDEREPLYPFGHGLGYTNWEYVGIEASG